MKSGTDKRLVLVRQTLKRLQLAAVSGGAIGGSSPICNQSLEPTCRTYNCSHNCPIGR